MSHVVIGASEQASWALSDITSEPCELCVETGQGEIVMGAEKVKKLEEDGGGIQRVWLQPTPFLSDKAKKQISEAQTIFLGPGQLYTDIAPVLAVEGISDALRESKADLVFVGDEKQRGIIESFLPRAIDECISHNEFLQRI